MSASEVSAELRNQLENNAMASLPASLELINLLNRRLLETSLKDAAVGAAAGSLNVATESLGIVNSTLLTLTDQTIAVTDALAYASQKIYDFPAGRILLLGCVSYLKWGVTTARASTINDNASLTYAIGSAAASNVTLSGTMVDMHPKTTEVLDGAVAAYTAQVGAALAAAAQFDGTGTAIDAFLNVGFETGTDIDADGTLKVSGTIQLTWLNLGDF